MCFTDMPRNLAFYLPIISFTWVLLSLALTLILALAYDHIPKNSVPYISMLGDWPPERGVFSFCLSVAGALSIIVVYCRYRQISEQIKEENFLRVENVLPKWFLNMNIAILIFGFFMGIGLTMTGSFQLTDASKPHFIGAFFFVASGIICILLHTLLCCTMCNHTVDPDVQYGICLIRGIIATVCTCTYLVFLLRIWEDDTVVNMDKPYHLARTTCQWIGTISLSSYFLTYIYEFRRLNIICKFHTEQIFGDNMA